MVPWALKQVLARQRESAKLFSIAHRTLPCATFGDKKRKRNRIDHDVIVLISFIVVVVVFVVVVVVVFFFFFSIKGQPGNFFAIFLSAM